MNDKGPSYPKLDLSAMPLVSIGLPVYNGERYLRGALDSLLAQDYPNFELVISDNGSTDETPQICREYTLRDERIRYYRVDQNQGVVWNFNRVFELSRGEYFMWHGVNDRRTPDCVRRCMERLLAWPDAALCYTGAQSLDANGNLGDLCVQEVYGHSKTPTARLKEVIRASGYCEASWGVIRASALRRAGPMFVNIAPDVVLLVGLAILGRFECVEEPLHLVRWRAAESWEQFRSRILLFISPHPGRLHYRFPATKLVWDHVRQCWRVPTSLRERIRCLMVLISMFPYISTSHLLDEWPGWWVTPVRAMVRGIRRLKRLRVHTPAG